ncbi:unnamed protein product, partial [Ilex paraguariensis]
GAFVLVLKWVSDLLHIFKKISDSYEFMGCVVTISWVIWNTMNNFVFNHVVPNALVTLLWAQCLWFETVCYAMGRHMVIAVGLPHLQQRLMDCPGQLQSLSLCCDGAFKKAEVAIGVILKDFNGTLEDGI